MWTPTVCGQSMTENALDDDLVGTYHDGVDCELATQYRGSYIV